jgi:hypothetical protein
MTWLYFVFVQSVFVFVHLTLAAGGGLLGKLDTGVGQQAVQVESSLTHSA